MTENPLLRLGFHALGFCQAKPFIWKRNQKSLKFAPCDKLESSKASIPQIVFQAIVASFLPRKPAFLRQFLREIVAKNHTALNKEKRLCRIGSRSHKHLEELAPLCYNIKNAIEIQKI